MSCLCVVVTECHRANVTTPNTTNSCSTVQVQLHTSCAMGTDAQMLAYAPGKGHIAVAMY